MCVRLWGEGGVVTVDPVGVLAERVAAASAKRVEIAVEKALQLGDRGVAVWRVNGVVVRALPDRQVPYGHVYEFSVPPWRPLDRLASTTLLLSEHLGPGYSVMYHRTLRECRLCIAGEAEICHQEDNS